MEPSFEVKWCTNLYEHLTGSSMFFDTPPLQTVGTGAGYLYILGAMVSWVEVVRKLRNTFERTRDG